MEIPVRHFELQAYGFSLIEDWPVVGPDDREK